MTSSIVIPSSERDLPIALELKKKLEGKGAGEILIEASGSWTENRNHGAARATGSSIVFIDADIEDADKVDYSTLESYGYDIAQPYFRMADIDVGWQLLQNLSAASGLPFTTFGAFLYVSRRAWREVGPFRTEIPSDDTDWGHRAWLQGYRLEAFPFTVKHLRPLNYLHGVGNPITKEGEIWGLP